MDNNANLAYLTVNDRKLKGQPSPTMLTPTYKRYTEELNDLLDFATDVKNCRADNTLQLNVELIESARAYKSILAEKECTITTLTMDLSGLGWIEQENKMLEAENLKLRSDNQMWQTEVNDLKLKLEKATKCQWWID